MLKSADIERDGDFLDYTASAAKSRGDVVSVGGLAGILTEDAVSGDTVPARVRGVAVMNKKSTASFSEGDTVEWDNDGTPGDSSATAGSGALDVDGSGDFDVGKVIEDAGTSDETVRVYLNF